MFQEIWLRDSGVLGDESELELPLGDLQEIYSHIYQYGPRGEQWVQGWRRYSAYEKRVDVSAMIKKFIEANFGELSRNLNGLILGSTYEMQLKQVNRQFSLLYTRLSKDFYPQQVLDAMSQERIFNEYRATLKDEHDDAYIDSAYHHDLDGLNSYLMNDDILRRMPASKAYLNYKAYDDFISDWLTE
jgi:hypothetical protein